MNLTENKILDQNFTARQSIAGSEENNGNLYNEFQDLSNSGKNNQSSELTNMLVSKENLLIVGDNSELIDTKETINDINILNQNQSTNESQKLDILLISIKDLILITDEDGVILDCNVSKNNLSHINADLFINKSISELFHDTIAKEFIHKIHYTLENRELINYKYHIESGSVVRHFESTLSRISDKKVVVSIRGIDNPYETENKLKNINSLQSLINGISSDIIQSKLSNYEKTIKLSLTQLGIITQVDRVSIFKIDHERNSFEISDEWCAIDIASDSDNPEVDSNDVFQKWIENFEENKHVYIPSVDLIKTEYSSEKSIFNLKGIKSILAVPMNYNGSFIGFIIFYSVKSYKYWDEETINILKILGDIIAGSIKRSEFELELINQKKQAELVVTKKSEFVANVCREFKIPMNTILNLSEGLVSTNLDNHSLKKSSVIYKKSKRLMKLLNDINKLSQIDSGMYEINEEPVYIKALLSEIQQVFSNKLSEKKILLNIEIHNGFPDKIIFDDSILRSILYNLVGNAVKFTDNGRVDIIADVTYGLGNGIVDICFIIKDTGIGIEPEFKDLIFDTFYRIDNNSYRKHKGLGLGLTITKRLVDLVDGSINVESIQGSGSTFTVEFKKVKVFKEQSNKNGIENKNYLYNFDYSRILIFDEIKQSREMIKSYLSDFNFSIYTAENEQEIIDYLNHIKYDLILLNLKSNYNDYTEIFKSIKNIDLKKIPVVAISPANIFTNESQIINKFSDYIHKPYSKNELLKCLSKHLPHNKVSVHTELNDNDVNVLVAKNLVDSIDKQVLTKFINEFELRHKDKIQEIVDYFDKGTIDKIILDFNNFAGNYGIEAFSDLSQQIINATENLDYDAINDSANTIMKSIAYCKHVL